MSLHEGEASFSDFSLLKSGSRALLSETSGVGQSQSIGDGGESRLLTQRSGQVPRRADTLTSPAQVNEPAVGSLFAQSIEITVSLAKRRWLYLRDLVLSGALKQYQQQMPSNESVEGSSDKSSRGGNESDAEEASIAPVDTSRKRKRKTYGVQKPQDPLIKACKRGDMSSLRSIVAGYDQGYDISAYFNAIDVAGSHSILHTVWPGHYQALELLLRHKADPNQQNNRLNTALHLACERENRKIIKLLITHGAKVDVTNSKGLQCYETCYTPEDQLAIKSYVQRLVVAQEGKFEVDNMVLRQPKKDDFGPFRREYYISRDKRRDQLVEMQKTKNHEELASKEKTEQNRSQKQPLYVIHSAMMKTLKQQTYGSNMEQEALPAPCSSQRYCGKSHYNPDGNTGTPRGSVMQSLRVLLKEEQSRVGSSRSAKRAASAAESGILDAIERRPDMSVMVREANAKMGRRIFYAHQLEEEQGEDGQSRPKSSGALNKLASMARGCLYYREETLFAPSVFVPPKVPHKPCKAGGQNFRYTDAKELHGLKLDQFHLGVRIAGQRRGSEVHRQDQAKLEMVVRVQQSGKRLLPMVDPRAARRFSLLSPHGLPLASTPKPGHSAGRRFSVLALDNNNNTVNEAYNRLFTSPSSTTLSLKTAKPTHNLLNKQDVAKQTALGETVYLQQPPVKPVQEQRNTARASLRPMDELLREYESELQQQEDEESSSMFRRSDNSNVSRSLTSRQTMSRSSYRSSKRSDLTPSVTQALYGCPTAPVSTRNISSANNIGQYRSSKNVSDIPVPNTANPPNPLLTTSQQKVLSKGALELENNSLKKASERTQVEKLNRAATRRQLWTSLRKTRQSKDQEFLQFVNKHI